MSQDEIKLVYYISLKKSNVVDINETLLQQLAKEMMLTHVDLVKNCSIPAVVGQSEQLVAFGIWLDKNDKHLENGNITETVQEYLKGN